jgi:hypothetical protein
VRVWVRGGPTGGDPAGVEASLVVVEPEPCRWREKIPPRLPPVTGRVVAGGLEGTEEEGGLLAS